MSQAAPEICIGLMSGTSLDAIDAAACEFDAHGRLLRLLGSHTETYPPPLRTQLLDLQQDPQRHLAARDWAELDQSVAECFAQTANALIASLELAPASVRAIGSHGQTVFHDPALLRTSLQLGNPSLIAARTGICTVADFRRADMALQGHGAPLVPAFHHAVFAAAAPCVIVNIGGIANITVLPDAEADAVFGFDTGPGNALLDDWTQRHRQLPYDEDGAWAASGRVNDALLAQCLADPYFAAPPPKSTGRETFNLRWLENKTDPDRLRATADVQATLLSLTVETIVAAVERHAPANAAIYVCGGGARNGRLMDALAQRAGAARSLASTAALGLDPMWVEACAFAWLAWRTIHGLPGNLPAVTGASRPARLGGIFAP